MADNENTPQSVMTAPKAIGSEALFAGSNELVIVHHGTTYRLRITRQDKLILTK